MMSAEEKESAPASEEKSNDEDDAKSVDSFQKEASSLVILEACSVYTQY